VAAASLIVFTACSSWWQLEQWKRDRGERIMTSSLVVLALTNQNSVQAEIKSRLKLESFVFQIAIQKFKDQDI
jgi:hypothetical protein